MTDKNEKKIGVVGGMGPLATQLFYKMVIERTEAFCDQDHIDMIILNHASMPDRTASILAGKTEPLYEKLLADCLFLEASGVSHIAIPCNTTHFLVDRLQESLTIPIINMIQESVKGICVDHKAGSKIGILATDGTLRLGLYQKECEAVGLVPIVPSQKTQKRVMRIIYDGIKEGGTIDPDDFIAIEAELLTQNCEAAVLACTELSCFKELYKLSDFYADAMEYLAKKTILVCGKQYKGV